MKVHYMMAMFIFSFMGHSHVLADDLKLTDKELQNLRNEVKAMFYHAYEGYMKFAIPYDELRPLTCDGHDTWGSYSLTLIDVLDTLAVMGNHSEFRRVYELIAEREDFEADINVSVFETNIRVVGGLLSGHLMARRMGVEPEDGWPCKGPLLRLAVDAATRLLPAFDTPTGMPYGTVNLRYGVPDGETPITCSAGVGTFIMEFGTIARLTGDTVFEEVALRAMHSLWQRRSRLNLIGNHINVLTGHWTGSDAGIGAGVDSFFEYLVKGSFLFQRPELMDIFREARRAIDKHLRHEDWYLWKSLDRGQVSMAVFQSLEAFWPGVLTLVGDIGSAQKTLFNYHQVQKQYGFTPEFYSIPQGSSYAKRSGYPLRPEFVESLMYVYQATGDHIFLKMGADLLTALEHSTKTDCGYATVRNVADHSLDNRMESFFLAETTKYLFLLFHEDHWLHADGASGRPFKAGNRHCILDAGGYFFNTEAHPIDSGALACCSGPEEGNFALSPVDLVDLILDPTEFLAGYEGKPLEQKLKENDPPQGAEPDEEESTSPEDLQLTEGKAPSSNPTKGKDEGGGPPELPRDEASHAGEAILVEKDRNKSEYEGRTTGLLGALEDKRQNEGGAALWGPHFSTEGDDGKENLPVGEIVEASPSVSSSKFPLGNKNRAVEEAAAAAAAAAQAEARPQPKKAFSLEDLRRIVRAQVFELRNRTEAAPYSLLSCPVSFVESFHFKGQMIITP